MRADAVREFDRVFERELGAGADREVRGVRGVAHQHDRRLRAVARCCANAPILVDDAREANPLRRAAQMRGVRHQRVAVQILREELFAERDAVFLAHFVETGGAPHALRRFDDERGRVIVETIGVRLEPAEFGFFEREREGVEELLACRARRSGNRACRCRADRWPRTFADRAVQRRRTR